MQTNKTSKQLSKQTCFCSSDVPGVCEDFNERVVRHMTGQKCRNEGVAEAQCQADRQVQAREEGYKRNLMVDPLQPARE